MPDHVIERSEVLRRLARKLAGPGAAQLLDELDHLGLVVRLRDDADTAVPIMPLGSADPASARRGRLQVNVFGGLRIRIDDRQLDTGALRPLHRELLAALSIHAGTVVSCERLTEWFWPDRDPTRAQRSLQVGISEVRRALDRAGAPNSLLRSGSGYQLELADPSDCDARDFERLVGAASTTGRRGDRDRSAGCLDAAVALYRGDLVPEFGYPEWVVDERDRLRLSVVDALQNLARSRASDGLHGAAVAAARRGLELDRYRDGLWQQLIRSSEAMGEPLAAAAARHRRAAVLEDLDVRDAPAGRRLRSVG